MTRKILGILLLLWMIAIFMFSNQPSEKSSKTSAGVIKTIVQVMPKAKQMNEFEKMDLIDSLQNIVRKSAHYSAYLVGGILAISFISTFNITEIKKIIYSILFGLSYAVTDEIHQWFIPGRSCELRDVLIDTSGVVTGVFIVMIVFEVVRKVRKSC